MKNEMVCPMHRSKLCFRLCPVSPIIHTLSHALQTAEIIKQSLPQCVMEFDDRLRERHLGDLHGLDIDEARLQCPEGMQALKSRDLDSRIPGAGESLKDLEERASLAISALSKRFIGAHPKPV
jgi:probable phosphoglycerate mutase